ncbi:MAG: L-aspartate oxidase [Bdellovibrionota bacterium]|nr:MAG: L-aspartate oxidase [Bdellovibrionota bacterium]
MERFDFLVIGGGIAGLTFALHAAAHGRVAVLSKKELTISSTAWAQGGVAAVTSLDDKFELHVQDTLTAGAGLCKREIVELVVREAPERIRELIERGVAFDRESDGTHYHLHREGGHSRRRIFHTADATGFEIQRALNTAAALNPNIVLMEGYHAIDLLTSRKFSVDEDTPNRCVGAYVLCPDGTIKTIIADKTLVATGGAGKVYLYTSNPDVATGDGIAMCFRAGAPVANMEFYQFHPTCLYHPKAKSFLITEAMRGEGAKLRRLNGETFMERYHELAELAPRDIVARAIDNEMKRHGEEYVLLDITHRDPEFVRSHFPTIYQRCLEYGYDITREAIPVVPAAHYCCGGVAVDEHARTPIRNLYAAGECANTGLHGANRLASNSLLEGLVFGYRAAHHAISHLYRQPLDFDIPPWDVGTAVPSDEAVIITQNWDEIRRCMWNFVGIVRSTRRLERALRRSEMIEREIHEYYWHYHVTPDLLELRNLSLVAHLIIQSALQRKESRGLHYMLDYPEVSNAGMQDTVISSL